MKKLLYGFIFSLMLFSYADAQIATDQIYGGVYTKAEADATTEAAITEAIEDIPATDLSDYYTKAQTESTVAVMINDNAQAKYWYPANMANGDYTGEVTIETVASSQTIYNAVYLSSSGWAAARANADSTLPALGMALETGTGAKKILLRGYVRNTSWSFTKGNLIYVSTSSAGAITATKPSTSGNRIDIIGVAVSADIIYFNPTNVFWEL
jgi:hypothetical protein